MYWTDRWLIDVLSGLIVEYDGWSVLRDYAVSASAIDERSNWFGGFPLKSEVIDLMDGRLVLETTAKERGNWFGGFLISGDLR